MHNSAFVFLIFCSVILKLTDGQLRIIGGLPAPARAAPYHASLQGADGVHVCGGAILSKTAIISAAHCFVGANIRNIRVAVGSNDLTSGYNQKYNVSKIIPHEKHNQTTKVNDIAILITEKPITMSCFVKPLRILTTYITGSEVLTFTGFGAETNPGNSTTIMQTIDMKSLNLSICKYAYRNIRPLYSTQLCTFNTKGQGSCHGDSGGPLVKNNALVGIASFGVPCAIGYPDVFTRTSFYIHWILKNVPDA